MMTPKIGSDVEFFVLNSKGDSVVAEEFFPYYKPSEMHPERNQPLRLRYNNGELSLADGELSPDEAVAIHVDGMAMEYSIPICYNEKQFIEYHLAVQKYIKDHILPEGYTALFMGSVPINDYHRSFEQVMEMGCMPDFNAYDGAQNPVPDVQQNLRAAGAHIHYGYDGHDLENNENISRAFDIFVTLPMTAIDPDKARRCLYGKAGSYRPKPYGLECRQLSNFGFDNPEILSYIYRQSVKAFNYAMSNHVERFTIQAQFAQDLINMSASQHIPDFLKDYEVSIPEFTYA